MFKDDTCITTPSAGGRDIGSSIRASLTQTNIYAGTHPVLVE